MEGFKGSFAVARQLPWLDCPGDWLLHLVMDPSQVLRKIQEDMLCRMHPDLLLVNHCIADCL